jgi:hypothetical protein
MRRIANAGWTLAIWGCASWALCAAPAHIDRPTPPPCAADGTCYPNENTWGWYPCHWRKWPGEELVPTPAGTQPTPSGRPGELQPYETPTPEQEDIQAPPSTKKPETATAPATEGAPPLPPAEEGAPGQPSPNAVPPTAPAPSYPTPNYPVPMHPMPNSPGGVRPSTSDSDPPPSLPQRLSALSPRAAAEGFAPAARPQDRLTITRPRHDASNDPPPQLPSLFHSAAM